MIMIIEILLTIRAWRKGWKGYALLPIAIGMSVSFLIGAAVGASGGTIENILPLCVLIELMMIISLIVMAVRGPSCVEKTQEAGVPDLTTKVAA